VHGDSGAATAATMPGMVISTPAVPSEMWKLEPMDSAGDRQNFGGHDGENPMVTRQRHTS